MGYPIPGSSTITQLATAVTVPQVLFTTGKPVSVAGATAATSWSVGLYQGAPSPIAAAQGGASTPVAAGASPTAYGGKQGTGAQGAGVQGASSLVAAGASPSAFGGFSMGSTFVPAQYNPSSTSTGGPVQVTTNAAPRKQAGAFLGMVAGGAVALFAL